MHLRTLLLALLTATGLGTSGGRAAPVPLAPGLAAADDAAASGHDPGAAGAVTGALAPGPRPGALQVAVAPPQPFLGAGLPVLAMPLPETPAPRGPRVPLVPRLRLSHAHAHASAITCNLQQLGFTPTLRRSRLHAPAFSSGTPPPGPDA
ncbi:MAG TPA: hypothetical protein VK939_17345 [Longimicrobiales bacterium]|nr:hypothetical protein [Longimicrobiales bacterium]